MSIDAASLSGALLSILGGKNGGSKLWITSLNSHYPLRELSTEFGSLVSR